jgi:hypothetical protein
MDNSENISRRIGRRAVNKAQAFFEEHDMIFQEVHQENDNGKDAFLGLAWSGPDAGLIVWLQIKGGEKYKLRRKRARYGRAGRHGCVSWDWSARPRDVPARGRRLVCEVPGLRDVVGRRPPRGSASPRPTHYLNLLRLGMDHLTLSARHTAPKITGTLGSTSHRRRSATAIRSAGG